MARLAVLVLALSVCNPPPASAPAIVGPGAISTEAPEFAVSFADAGNTAYFNRASPDRSRLILMTSRRVEGVWRPAEPLPFSTGEYRDVDPHVSLDGTRLYFSSNRPGRAGAQAAPDFNTWYAPRDDAGWGAPVELEGPASGPDNEVFVSLARDGTLYYASNATGGGDIYRVAPGGQAERLPAEINSDASESNPAISPDGDVLIFASERPGGAGGSDLYASRRRATGWTPAQSLGERVNSPQADFAPQISADGGTLYFTSERPGIAPAPASGRPPGDIYAVALAPLLRDAP